jgi:hypothetical protein
MDPQNIFFHAAKNNDQELIKRIIETNPLLDLNTTFDDEEEDDTEKKNSFFYRVL